MVWFAGIPPLPDIINPRPITPFVSKQDVKEIQKKDPATPERTASIREPDLQKLKDGQAITVVKAADAQQMQKKDLAATERTASVQEPDLGKPKIGQAKTAVKVGEVPTDSTKNGIVISKKEEFQFNKDVVIDNHTGLMWARNANLARRNIKTFYYAGMWIQSLKIGGYNDWRIPKAEELKTLSNRDLSSLGFVNVQDIYWTSSEDRVAITFKEMSSEKMRYYQNTGFFIWPVRGGK
jgi:hypothetical protein